MSKTELQNILLDFSEPAEQDEFLTTQFEKEFEKLLKKIDRLEDKVSLSDREYQKGLVSIKEEVKVMLEDYFSGVKTKIDSKLKTVNQIIKDTETKLDVSDISLKDELKEIKTELMAFTNGLSSKQSKLRDELMDTVSDVVKDRKAETKEFRKLLETVRTELKEEIKKPKGGGSIPLRIQVNGTNANTRYADINIVSSGATVANNDTTKITTITIPAGSGSGFTYVNETPNGAINGDGMGNGNVTFTLANTPTAPTGLMLFGSGGFGSTWFYIQGVDYTISGTTITMTTAPLSATILRAYYA